MVKSNGEWVCDVCNFVNPYLSWSCPCCGTPSKEWYAIVHQIEKEKQKSGKLFSKT